MATEIKQGVKYVIEAEDKATRTAEKAAENVKQSADKVAKSAAATAEAGKKSLGGVNIVAEGLRAGLSRIGGGLGNLVPIFSKAGAAGAAAFGVIGLAVQAIYSAIKTLGALISSALGSDLDKQLTQTRDHIAQINHDMEEMEHGMEQAEARANRAAEARNLELDAIERMTKAQIEYNRQQALALANTEKEKQAVNDLYDEKAAEAQEESRSAERQARRERLENELARQQEAKKEYERNAGDVLYATSRLNAKGSSIAQDAGFFGEAGKKLVNKLPGFDIEQSWETSAKISEAVNAGHKDFEMYVRKAEMAGDKIKRLQDQLAAIDAEEDAAAVESDTRKLAAANARRDRQRAEDEEAARAKAAADEKAAAAAEREERQRADMLARKAKEDAAEIARAQKQAAQDVHRERLRQLAIEKDAAKSAADDQAAAEKRLAAARSAVAQAWGWYRDKDSMKAQIEEEKAQAEAEKQFEKDFERLRMNRNWRKEKNLSVDQEAVRRLALAKEEERDAQKAVLETAEHTRAAAESLAAIEAQLAQEGE